MKCTYCNHENAEDAVFCTECGKKIETTEKKTCSKCGAEISNDALFCTSCGERIHSGIRRVDNGGTHYQTSQITYSQPQGGSDAGTPEAEKTVKNKEPLYICISVVGAVVVFALFKFVIFGNQKDLREPVAETQNGAEYADTESVPYPESTVASEIDVVQEETQEQTETQEITTEETTEASLQADYILPQSDTVRLKKKDIKHLTLQELNYAKNEIYARHGRKFDSQELRRYFESKEWYHGTIAPADFNESVLSEVERANVILIRDREYSIDPNGYPLDQGMDTLSSVKSLTADSIEAVFASSELSEYDMTHFARFASDGDRTTGWVEGVSGQGEGETLTFQLNDTYEIHGFRICAGYHKSKELYRKNSRPAKLRIQFDNSDGESFDLADEYKEQSFTLASPVSSSVVVFKIETVYPGNTYEDTVISEISLF